MDVIATGSGSDGGAFEPGQKLAIAIRYLATQDSHKSLVYSFWFAHNTICNFLVDVWEAIISEYAEDLISWPVTPADWLNVAEGFKNSRNLPHCIRTIDESI